MGEYDQISPPSSQPDKEKSLIVNLMKHSKKTYDSFQDELEDYIQVQRARGLEPKTCFRQMRGDYLETCRDKEKVDFRTRYRRFDQRLPTETIQTHPRSRSASQTVENQLPQWLPAHDSMRHCPFTRNCFSEKPAPLNFSHQEYNYSSYSVESRVYRHLSETNTSAHKAGHERIQQKRGRHPEGGREKSEQQQPEHKRNKGCEETDLDKHKSFQKSSAEVRTVRISTEKLKNQRERKRRDVASKKEDRKRRKEKKEQGTEGRTEEEMLWDQSILGF